MKKIAKILIVSLVLCLALGSCSLIRGVKQEADRIADFTVDFAEVMENPTVENAESLIHPKSSLTAESVVDKIAGNEKLQELMSSVESEEDITIGEISEPEIKFNDPELGGNVYAVEVEIIINGTPVTVSLDMLSSEEGFGLLDFEIK
ncbi:MAG: hypothetical protein ACI3XL_02280 [Eubacteriales bacterium]